MLFRMVRICNSQFKCNCLKHEKIFLNSFFHCWNLHQIFNILKKRMIVIGNAIPKLKNVKSFVRPLSKKRRLRTRFVSQHVKAFRILLKSPWEHFSCFLSFSGKLIWKTSPLVLGKVLVVFVNGLTAIGKYPVQDCETLKLPFQIQLSEKWKIFSQFFV